jgi:hypothetical protein
MATVASQPPVANVPYTGWNAIALTGKTNLSKHKKTNITNMLTLKDERRRA